MNISCGRFDRSRRRNQTPNTSRDDKNERIGRLRKVKSKARADDLTSMNSWARWRARRWRVVAMTTPRQPWNNIFLRDFQYSTVNRITVSSGGDRRQPSTSPSIDFNFNSNKPSRNSCLGVYTQTRKYTHTCLLLGQNATNKRKEKKQTHIYIYRHTTRQRFLLCPTRKS